MVYLFSKKYLVLFLSKYLIVSTSNISLYMYAFSSKEHKFGKSIGKVLVGKRTFDKIPSCCSEASKYISSNEQYSTIESHSVDQYTILSNL